MIFTYGGISAFAKLKITETRLVYDHTIPSPTQKTQTERKSMRLPSPTVEMS